MFAGISVSQSLCSLEYLEIGTLDKDCSSCACDKEPQSFLLSQRQRVHRRWPVLGRFWDVTYAKCEKGSTLTQRLYKKKIGNWAQESIIFCFLAERNVTSRFKLLPHSSSPAVSGLELWAKMNLSILNKAALSDGRSNWDKWVQDNRGKLISFHQSKEKEINRTWLGLLW